MEDAITPTSEKVLVLNAGSSTLKFALFDQLQLNQSGTIELTQSVTHIEAVHELMHRFSDSAINAVAYRFVHGGPQMIEPVRIDAAIMEHLRKTIHLAPLHQPPAISVVDAAMQCFPSAIHVACFDTAFHATMPESERRLPIPRDNFDAGIRRYGFHGLSYESIASQLPSISELAATGRTIVCHLGSGASLCGMVGCVGQYTTMGLTPLDGLVMGSRSGRIDAGVVLHWMREGISVTDIETLLTKQSGMLGISGVSSDMRELIRESANNPNAALAIDMFSRSVAREIAAAATAISGLDTVVFTAGIGQHSPIARAAIVGYLNWLGAGLDSDANEQNMQRLHSSSSKIEILCVPTDEQKVIAHHATQMMRTLGYPHPQGS